MERQPSHSLVTSTVELGDVELAKPVPLTRNTSVGTFTRRVRRLDRNLIVFGLLSATTLAIVVSMSVYVVHNTEVRFKTRHSGRLLDDYGHEVSTTTSEHAVGLTYGQLTDPVLAHLKRVNLHMADGDVNGWDVQAYEKHTDQGIITLHGPAGRILAVNDGSNASLIALQQGWSELGLAQAAAEQAGASAGAGRGRLLLEQHGRHLQVSTGEGIAQDVNTDGSGSPLDVPPPVPFPDDSTVFSYTDGCTQGDLHSFIGGRYSNPQVSPKPCNCLKREYWSDPAQDTCAKRPPASVQLTEAYLDQWAYEGEDCSAKPCFNFDANTAVPFEQEYRGNAAFQAAYPNKTYTGRTSSSGWSSLNADGTGAGQLEALACRGRITKAAAWWKWWESDEIKYMCALRSSDEYASRRTPCSCPWYSFLGCSGTNVHTHNPDLGPVCGKHGECFLTTQDMNKYCQPRVGQDLSAYS